MGAAAGTLDQLRDCFDSVTKSGDFAQVWEALGFPCWDIWVEYRTSILTSVSSPHQAHLGSLVFLTGRGDYFDCFGSTDHPFYSTDNEFRIKTMGSLNPNISFYR